ncbi:bifunctional UDP-sugar hydrolase/5'-nucleotidase [Streptomyces sp. B3I8]|uniref:bifunctional metallophosphatase/5'-nucleotidase n=1 Tax=Streptomyces sp. B3I8 TaxID=3042303 RepID=UPI00277F5E80|nr:5'-nucleotidase C-terminal domain-containing protein [Streptomyces sp. B3I8]MDQ0786371.1 2',3'-cyclic-nucleotide 2'-phosphodiesterase (5'-nucleotidase family) [Streptomyces sp. B3I8]
MPLNRRRFLENAALTTTAATLTTTATATTAHASGPHKKPERRHTLTVMGTTDLHGHLFNWDYYKDATYTDTAGNTLGLARISTLVNHIRKEKGRHNTLLIDAGDTIQGTPLTYYYAKVDPITAKGGPVHPMARAMNTIGYDAAALGNHEFNYGIDTLREFESQLDFPLLGANAVDATTLKPAFPPYLIKTFHVHGAPPVKVAVLGLTNPGIAIWDKANVQGRLAFPELKVTNDTTGKTVVLSEPLCFAERLTVFDIELTLHRGRWEVDTVSASLHNTNQAEDDPRITELLTDEHAAVVTYVNQVVGTATQTLTTVDARYKDAPIIDLITKVQEDVVKTALAGTEHARLPVLAQASPFSRTSEIPAGDVTVRALSSLYVYDNTLVAKLLTGAQIRAYLEYSAQYYVQTAPDAPVDIDALTNADDRPDYNYDYVSGLTYDIDIAQPAGSRIKNLAHDGNPLDDTAPFVLAVNNYRANGGGAFPHIATTKELWTESTEIRTRIAEWVTAKGVLDPQDFASTDWKLTRDGTPVF